jgi:hypothetical protein
MIGNSCEKRNAYSILMGRTEARRPLGTPRSRKGYNIEKDMKEISWETVEWIYVSLANLVMKLRIE